MTEKELANLKSKRATLEVTDRAGLVLFVSVRIEDSRTVYGREELLVTPESGEGQAWVSADRVKVRGQ